MIFILIFLAGFFFLSALSRELKPLEKISLAFPAGLGMASFIMFKLNFFATITLSALYAALFFFTICCIAFLFWRYKKEQFTLSSVFFHKPDYSQLNLVMAVFLGMIFYLVWGISRKCLYWPPAEFDTILGYDLLSKAIAHEGTLANSILTNDYLVKGCGPRLLYPPLLALDNAICYMVGMESPKIINTLFYVSWIGIFYSLLGRFVNSTAASFFTLMVVIVPEMYAHASFSLTNLPCAIYSSAGIFSLLIWNEKRIKSFLPLAVYFFMCMLWTRADSIFLFAACAVAVSWVSIRRKDFLSIAIFALGALPFITWSVFSKMYIPRTQTDFFVKEFSFNAEKLSKVFHEAFNIMFNSNIYGATFSIFLFVLIIHIGWMIYKRTFFNGFYLAILLMSWVGYTMIFYFINETDGTLFSAGGWLQSGYKRGLFSYAPLALYYCAISPLVINLFNKIHSWLVLKSS